MIDFELEPQILKQIAMYHMAAAQMMRPISREYDEHEHGEPRQFWETMWSATQTLGAAVAAAGTPEQRERFLRRFREGQPKWGAMAITEPSCGSDSAAITTTAVRDGDHWIINGTKIFCTAGQMAAEKSEGFVVVWATVDRKAGRAGIKPFVVEHNTPGMTVVRVENKLGIRASDTAMLSFENCRVRRSANER